MDHLSFFDVPDETPSQQPKQTQPIPQQQQQQLQQQRPQQQQITMTGDLAVEKFRGYLDKLNKGELESNVIQNWDYYIRTYLVPFFDTHAASFRDTLVSILIAPKTRINLLGDLFYLFDYILTKVSKYTPILQDSVVTIFKWCYFRILYQQLIAHFVQSQGVTVNTQILETQQIKIEKVLKRWRQPAPTKQEWDEWCAKQNSTPIQYTTDDPLLMLLEEDDKNDLQKQFRTTFVPTPVFPAPIMSELQTVQDDLLNQYKTRLEQQRQQFSSLKQQYNDYTTTTNNNNYDNYSEQNTNNNYSTTNNNNNNNNNNASQQTQQAYLTSQSHLETWKYGGFDDDLLNSLINDIVGTNSRHNTNNQKNSRQASHLQHSQQQHHGVKRSLDHSIDSSGNAPSVGGSNNNQIDSLNHTKQRFPPQSAPNYTTDTFRLVQPTFWKQLYSHQFTCTTCGMFFNDREIYTEHILWHKTIETLKREKEIRVQKMKTYNSGKNNFTNDKINLYYSGDDWVHYRHTSSNIPFHLLPPQIQEQKQAMHSYEEMHAQQQQQLQAQALANGTVITDSSITKTAKELWDEDELAVLYACIMTHDKKSQYNIYPRIESIHRRLYRKQQEHHIKQVQSGDHVAPIGGGRALLLSLLDEMNIVKNNASNDDDDDNHDRFMNNNDDDGDGDNGNNNRGNPNNIDALPYYNDTTRQDSLSQGRLPQPPVQLRKNTLSSSNNSNTYTSMGSQSHDDHNMGLSTTTCILCSDEIQQRYNDRQDAWVYANCVVLTYQTLLRHCILFLLHVKQFKFEKRQKQLSLLADLNTGGMTMNKKKQMKGMDDNNDGGKKTDKMTFTAEEETAIEKLLQPLLKRYCNDRYNNHLIHYQPCFHGILKEVMKQ